MNYTILKQEYTPNGRQIDIILNESNELNFALFFRKGEIGMNNKFLPLVNFPQAEVVFSDSLEFLLAVDAQIIEDLNNWNFNYTLYTESEFSRKMNGYTATPLNLKIVKFA